MIIFEGEELVLHHEAGDSDYLLVTFEGAQKTNTATTSFLGAKPARKNQINIVGITAKVDYWYISPETDVILNKINEIGQNYKTVVLLGLSMGAYAAIVFSKRLNATAVFASAPKWSLDPDECEIPRQYVECNFRAGMEKMGIRPSQVQGEIFVAYDPAEPVDFYHAHKIADEVKNVHLVPTFYTGHVIFDHLCGSENFRILLDALRSQECATAIPRTVSRIRRHHPTNIKARLRHATSAHPRLCKDLYERCLQDDRPALRAIDNDRELSNRILASLCWHRYIKEAVDYRRAITGFRATGRFARTTPKPWEVTDDHEKILTYHGTLLAYDVEGRHFKCQNSFLPDNNAVPVLRDARHKGNFLYVSLHGEIFYLRETENGPDLTLDSENRTALILRPFDPIDTGDKNLYAHLTGYCIRTREGYLCSSSDYTVFMDSPNLREWESYICIPS